METTATSVKISTAILLSSLTSFLALIVICCQFLNQIKSQILLEKDRKCTLYIPNISTVTVSIRDKKNFSDGCKMKIQIHVKGVMP